MGNLRAGSGGAEQSRAKPGLSRVERRSYRLFGAVSAPWDSVWKLLAEIVIVFDRSMFLRTLEDSVITERGKREPMAL